MGLQTRTCAIVILAILAGATSLGDLKGLNDHSLSVIVMKLRQLQYMVIFYTGRKSYAGHQVVRAHAKDSDDHRMVQDLIDSKGLDCALLKAHGSEQRGTGKESTHVRTKYSISLDAFLQMESRLTSSALESLLQQSRIISTEWDFCIT